MAVLVLVGLMGFTVGFRGSRVLPVKVFEGR